MSIQIVPRMQRRHHQQEQQEQQESPMLGGFSFRTFDMYRRFVQILQQNPIFLADFKNGTPHVDTCRQLIRRTFLHQQSEERIASMIAYLKHNAKTLFVHAENLPSNWLDAIKYTNDCIKLVKKVLQEKGVVIKNFVPSKDAVKRLALDVAEVMHDEEPTQVQLQAIEDYLLYDLKNPKRVIVTSTPKTLKSRRKEAKKLYRYETSVVDENKNPKLKMMIKKVPLKRPRILGPPNKGKSVNKVCEKNVKQEVVTSHEPEEYASISCDPVSRKLMQLGVTSQSENEPVFSECVHNTQDSWSKGFFKTEPGDDDFGHKASEYTVSILMNPYNNSLEDLNESSIKEEHVEHEPWNLKRKSPIDEHINDRYDKKFIKVESLRVQNNDYDIVNECNYKETPSFEMMMEPIVEITENNGQANNSFEVDVITCDEEPKSPEKVFDNQKAMNLSSNIAEVHPTEKLDSSRQIVSTSETAMTEHSLSNSKMYETASSTFTTRNDPRCDRVKNMSYSEVHKLLETVVAFCKVRNAVSLEEYLILKRTRDFMHWKSLKKSEEA